MSTEGTEIIRLQLAINYVQVVSVTLLAYDWLILFSDEVIFIWGSRWSFVTMLYLWSRYSPILDTTLGLLTHFAFLSPAECKFNDTLNSFLLAGGILASELVLIWRTFALWHDSKRVKYCLGGLWLLLIPLAIFSLVTFTRSTVYAPQPFTGQPGCNLVKASGIILGDFAGLAALEIVILLLTVVKGTQHIRAYTYTSPSTRTGVHLVRTLYRDGVMFFVCLTLLSVGTILAPVLGPKSNILMLPTFLRIMHSTLCCRVILHIRNAAATDAHASHLPSNSSSRIVGTMSTVRLVSYVNTARSPSAEHQSEDRENM